MRYVIVFAVIGGVLWWILSRSLAPRPDYWTRINNRTTPPADVRQDKEK